MKLFKAIFLLMLVVGVVSTATVGLLVLSDTRELLTRDAQELSGERVKQLRLKTERALEEPVRVVVTLARTPGFFALPLVEQRALVTSVLTQRRDVSAITIFDAHGVRIPGTQQLRHSRGHGDLAPCPNVVDAGRGSAHGDPNPCPDLIASQDG